MTSLLNKVYCQGFRLRLVGHSLGGAIASLLAIMLRKKSKKELGFSPELVSAVGYATPPCVSRELAENCSDFVTTVVMQVKIHSFLCYLLIWILQQLVDSSVDLLHILAIVCAAHLTVLT